MSDKQGRDAEALLDVAHLFPQALAQMLIETGKGLVVQSVSQRLARL
jgi:hypothetical protein